MPDQSQNEDFLPPGGEKKVLLHSCCAPCSGSVMEMLHQNGIELTIFFYNPNIHPEKEYEIRKKENIRYAEKKGIPFVDGDYDAGNWFEKMKGHEEDPERGERCGMCFEMRFVETAKYAYENDFRIITSCLGISRWKDFDQVTSAGERAASRFPGIHYWDFNWRKNGGSSRMYEIAKEEEFYQQQYCGCIYSLRDTNKWRKQNGRPLVIIGNDWYSEAVKK